LGIDYDLVARWLLQHNRIAHLIETGNTLIYREGVYEDFAEVHFKKVLFDAAEHIKKVDNGSLINRTGINEVMERANSWSLRPISAFECNQNIYNVSNGILNLDTYELMPHSPDWLLMSKSPSVYDPDAECPQFQEFLDQSLDKKYHPLMGELIGYIFWPQYHVHKAFMFLGPKRTGKSTTMRAIEAVIGQSSCSHASLQDLLENRFMRARLFGKKLNSSGDLPALPLKDVGIFKNMTGEDTIEVENKFEHPFPLANKAKLLFSANTLPRLRSPDEAFYGRWIIVPFENSVYGREDSQLTAKLTTPEELSGILNLGLAGLSKLRKSNWKFTYSDDGAAIYRKKSNPLYGFLEDRCVASLEGHIVKADFIMEYNQYTAEMGFPPISSKKALGIEMMDQTIIPVDTCYPKINGKQVEAWGGIEMKK
jgi:putative DNA primase/helicase